MSNTLDFYHFAKIINTQQTLHLCNKFTLYSTLLMKRINKNFALIFGKHFLS